MRRLLGLGYRRPFARWLLSRPAELGCLEVTAEHFYDRGEAELRMLAEHYPISVHGLGLSLGSPGELDREALARFHRVAELARAQWISEHVAFTAVGEVDLGHLNPIAPTEANLRLMAVHARELMERCGRPLRLENITSSLRLRGEMTETEFLNRLCAEAGCGLLLDVTNLYINSVNHGFDWREWLAQIEPANIRQVHIVGYGRGARGLVDSHAQDIQPEPLEIYAALADCPVEAVFIERDANFPPPERMLSQLRLLEAACPAA